jgi:hypothetical protein
MPHKEYEFTLFAEKAEGVYVAHALEAGMLATADELDTAIFQLGKMLVRHIKFAEKHKRPDQIYRNAAADVFQRFEESKRRGTVKLLYKEKKEYASLDNLPALEVNQTAYAAAC